MVALSNTRRSYFWSFPIRQVVVFPTSHATPTIPFFSRTSTTVPRCPSPPSLSPRVQSGPRTTRSPAAMRQNRGSEVFALCAAAAQIRDRERMVQSFPSRYYLLFRFMYLSFYRKVISPHPPLSETLLKDWKSCIALSTPS